MSQAETKDRYAASKSAGGSSRQHSRRAASGRSRSGTNSDLQEATSGSQAAPDSDNTSGKFVQPIAKDSATRIAKSKSAGKRLGGMRQEIDDW